MTLYSSFISNSHSWIHRSDLYYCVISNPSDFQHQRIAVDLTINDTINHIPITINECSSHVDRLFIDLCSVTHDMDVLRKNYFSHFQSANHLAIRLDRPENLCIFEYLSFWDTVEDLRLITRSCNVRDYKNRLPKSKNLKRLHIVAVNWSHCNVVRDLDVDVSVDLQDQDSLPSDLFIPKLSGFAINSFESKDVVLRHKHMLKKLRASLSSKYGLGFLAELLVLEKLELRSGHSSDPGLIRLLERTVHLREIKCRDVEKIKRAVAKSDNGSVRKISYFKTSIDNINVEPRKKCLAATETFFLAARRARAFPKDMVIMLSMYLLNTICDVRAWDRKPRQKKLKL